MRQRRTHLARWSRRRWLAGALGALALPVRAQRVEPSASAALSAPAARAIAELLRGREPRTGRVQLEIPKLAENGLAVPLKVRVDSPMSAADHVRTVHLIAPANPLPAVARLHFGPHSGEAYLSTRIRLADSQRVFAFAEMSDDSVWRADAHVVVTLGGCLDPIL
jgi:sulfur-oxidizing protein SoxY